jgi:hypothetical protein
VQRHRKNRSPRRKIVQAGSKRKLHDGTIAIRHHVRVDNLLVVIFQVLHHLAGVVALAVVPWVLPFRAHLAQSIFVVDHSLANSAKVGDALPTKRDVVLLCHVVLSGHLHGHAEVEMASWILRVGIYDSLVNSVLLFQIVDVPEGAAHA